MKMEYRLLANIMSKSLLTKLGLRYGTVDKFTVMAIIASMRDFNWSDIMFGILVGVVKGDNQSQGYAIQICFLLA